MTPITSPDAPAAIGPYSHAVTHGDLVFTSGQIPLDPKTGELCGDDIESQTQQVLKNLEAVLTAAGSSKSGVLKTTIFLKDLSDFQTVNGIYAEFFGDHKPARSTVQVAKLPLDVRVEIECVATVNR
ncbi:MAG: RidA family protein [Verrucomicrobiota bacterium]